MEKLNLEQFENLIGNTKVLERDPHGPKVLETADNRIIKLFRVKRLISSAWISPYAVRFARHARRIHALGVPAPAVERTAQCRAVKRQLVVYRKLPGIPLREALGRFERHGELLALLAEFIATLHEKGIYFRSLHLGNILLQAGPTLALIDVADMRLKKGPLSPTQRARNFRHLLRYPEDKAHLLDYGLERFLESYLTAASLPPRRAAHFRRRLSRLEPALART